jgi:hypothetical protein
MKIPRRGSVPTKVTKRTRVSVGVSAARTRRAARDLPSSDLSSKERPYYSSPSLVLAFGKLVRFWIRTPVARSLPSHSFLVFTSARSAPTSCFSSLTPHPSLPKMCVFSHSPRIESV